MEFERERGGEREGETSATEGLDKRARVVSGEVEQRRRLPQLLSPVRELTFKDFSLEPLSLPGGEVSILDGQLCERGGATFRESLIEGGDFFDEDAHRPPVTDDVMHRPQQHMIFFRKPHYTGSHQRPTRQIKCTLRFLRSQSPRLLLPLLFLHPAQVRELHFQPRRLVDELHGLAIDDTEAGAQDLVAADNFVEGERERGEMERAAKAESGRGVIGDAAGFELVEEPEALLCERERQRLISSDSLDRRQR
jgi:hypothetical protein